MNCQPFLTWLLSRGRRPALGLLLLLTLFLAVFAARVRVEADTRSMVSRQADQLAAYDRFLDRFGNDEDLLLSVSHPRLLQPDGLALLADLTRRVASIEGVRQVLSLANACQLVGGRYGAEAVPLLPAPEPAGDFQRRLQKALRTNPHYEGLLISADRHTAGMVIELTDHREDVALRGRLVDAARTLMAEYADRAELHLTGIGVQKIDVGRYVQRDQLVILPLVVAVLAAMLALIFRRLSGVLLPLLATAVSLVWTMGIYALCSLELNTITSLLPPVIMVLAVSNSVHLYNGWLHIEGGDERRIELLAAKLDELLLPCLFTALTTAFGLLSLTISAVPAVRQFGLFAALGVLIALLVSLVLVPIGLSFRPLPERRHREGLGLLRWSLQAIADLTTRRPMAILVVALVLLLGTLGGLPRLRNNTDLVGFLRADAPLAVDTRYIDEHLAGVNALEFMVSRTDGAPLESAIDYDRLADFESLAREQAPVAGVFSILPLLRQLNHAENGGDLLALPAADDDLRYSLDLIQLAPDQDLPRRLLTADRASARLSVRLHDVGSRTAAEVSATLVKRGGDLLGPDYRLVPTGSFYQMIRDSNRLVTDMVGSFTLSLGMILLAILALLRSLRLTLLAMIPNVIPILWTIGLMGWLGIDLSTGTAMICAVVIGLAVDDTIHYMVHYRRVYAGVVSQAVAITTMRTGQALMIASLVLVLGFWVGCLGSFKPTIYFSLLVGGTLLGALACDLLVLPACLVLGCSTRKENPA
jgi:hypothetical protein